MVTPESKKIAFATWPRNAKSLLIPVLRHALGASLELEPEVVTAVVPPPETEGRRYLIEYGNFAAAVVPRFNAFVAKGGEDSAGSFKVFASTEFAAYKTFLHHWVESDFAKAQLLVDTQHVRKDPGPVLVRALEAFDPGVTLDGAALDHATGRAEHWLATHPGPDLAKFRFYDPALFDQLNRLNLRRDVVQNVFYEMMGREPGKDAILHFQGMESPAALRNTLLGSKEHAEIATAAQSSFGSYDSVSPTVLMSAAFQRWERVRKNELRWPLSQVFISLRSKVIYCPIGKVACSFLKRQMVNISDVAHRELILENVHGLTDNVRTGMQLSDYREAQTFIASPDIFKFAVLRAPRDRLLSAYIEKFVINRTNPGNIFHTRPVLAEVQKRKGIAMPDPELGITFRDFITEITAQPSHTLDPHWRPQVDYLQGIAYDRIFNFDQLDAVIDLLEQRSGLTLSRQPVNVTGSGKGEVRAAADLLPAEIMGLPRLDQSSFFDSSIAAMVADYFSADEALLATTYEKAQT